MKTITGNMKIAEAIKNKRKELGLTIEAAASKAGVGTKTWSRYESGESIRKDKVRGVCKALGWTNLPGAESIGTHDEYDFEKNEAWSPYLVDGYGKYVAISFIIGSEILLDDLEADMMALSSMPRGSHIGELEMSWLDSMLPPQFLMKYDYDFLYALRDKIIYFRRIAPHADSIIAHSVIEELTLYLIQEESRSFFEACEDEIYESDEVGDEDGYGVDVSWAFDIFEDMDIITFLYSGWYLTEDASYHFDHWFEQQFFVEE